MNKSDFQLSDILLKNPHITGRMVDHELVLVLPEQGKVKVLNEVGARIWDLLDGNRSLQEISQTIQQEYDAPAAEVQADVLDFVSALHQKGMLLLPKP
jgi:coenzyme PQQ biosynthesis protein PqqD